MSQYTAAGTSRLIDLLRPQDAPASLATPQPAAAPRMLWEAFAEQALAHPARPAIVDDERTVEYGTLLHAATRVAHALRGSDGASGSATGEGSAIGSGSNAGVQQKAPIAIVMRKGWRQIAAAIGAQLAGAPYLPVPTDWPARRIETLVQSTGASVAIVGDDDESRLVPEGVRVLRFSDDGDTVPLEDVVASRDPRDLAYVIATSGTTGTPKVVMIEHGAAWNTIEAINRMFAVEAGDRVLALSSLHFDLSVWDIFGLLAVGGTIVVPDAARLRDPGYWAGLCRANGVTIWNSVPALARMFVEGGSRRNDVWAQATSLRLMMLSGDWIPLPLARQIRAERPDLELVSLGGATEASIWSIAYPISTIDPEWTSIPYGTALPGQSIAVLDASLDALPPWAEGEIHIGGVGLASGYWGDERLTSERFVTDARTGERWYRTGDLGKVWADGTVELLGRIDSQVKIAGHRVELGEIEAHLQTLPAIRTALVSYRPVGPQGIKQLVGYLVLADAQAGGVDAGGGHAAAVADPIEKLAFKLGEPGIRRFDAAAEAARVPLQLHQPEREELARQFRARRSHRLFGADAVGQTMMTGLLAPLTQITLDGFALPKRLYPSAGSLYPVHVYVQVRAGRVEGIAGGMYYWHPREGALYPLATGSEIPPVRFGDVNLRAAEQSAFAIFLVADLDAIAPLYPDKARDFCLLEAGYLGQALMTAATDAGLGLCPIGGIDGDDWKTLVQAGPAYELLHAFVGGVPAEEATQVAVEGATHAPAAVDLRTATGPDLRSATGQADAIAGLRSFLAERVPPHMIPSAWMVLDTIPLTDNGKVDRTSLPEPPVMDDPDDFDDTLTPTEVTVRDLWRQLRGDRTIGPDQGFFEAGGDSLLLLELQKTLQATFSIEVPLPHLFQYPTIRQLAAWIDQAPRDQAAPAAGL